jgi:uncharacterized protein YggE
MVVVLLALVLWAQTGCIRRGPAEVDEGVQRRTVRVSGSGRVEVQPDVATVRLGVQTEAKTASEALSQNSARMQALIDTLNEAGVAELDIQTESVRLMSRYGDAPPEPGTGQGERTRILVGYLASNVVQVRVWDLDRLGEMLDTAVRAGGNEIQGISFGIDDPSAVLDQAREAAWEDARRKADQLAGLAGAALGDAYTIEASSHAPGPIVRETTVREAAQAVPIEPGVQTLEVELTVEWILR